MRPYWKGYLSPPCCQITYLKSDHFFGGGSHIRQHVKSRDARTPSAQVARTETGLRG